MPARIVSKLIGNKYLAIAKSCYEGVGLVIGAKNRVPVLTVWGTVGGVALVHFTDWRLFLDYVPYINGKFKKDE